MWAQDVEGIQVPGYRHAQDPHVGKTQPASGWGDVDAPPRQVVVGGSSNKLDRPSLKMDMSEGEWGIFKDE